MESIKLKRCPICGGRTEMKQDTRSYTVPAKCLEQVTEQFWFVSCKKCEFIYPHCDFKDERAAMDFWNGHPKIECNFKQVVYDLKDNNSAYKRDHEIIAKAVDIINYLDDECTRLNGIVDVLKRRCKTLTKKELIDV